MNPGEQLTQAIKAAAEQHEPDGYVQWYVDDLTIDCDAAEFWRVVQEVIAAGHGEQEEAR